MKVVENGEKAHARFGEFVSASRAINERVRGNAAEQSVASIQKSFGSTNTVSVAQMLDHFQLCNFFGQVLPVHASMDLDRVLLLRKPVRMIEREARHREKEQDAEAGHGEIDMQLARQNHDLSFQERIVPYVAVRETPELIRSALM